MNDGYSTETQAKRPKDLECYQVLRIHVYVSNALLFALRKL